MCIKFFSIPFYTLAVGDKSHLRFNRIRTDPRVGCHNFTRGLCMHQRKIYVVEMVRASGRCSFAPFEVSSFVSTWKRPIRQAGIGVERVLLIWIVDRPVRAFLNIQLRVLAAGRRDGEHIYMRGEKAMNSATRYIHRAHKGNGQRRRRAHRRLFDHVQRQETNDDFGGISIELSVP